MVSDSSGICLLCLTWCTVRAEDLKNILDTYNLVFEIWAELLKYVKDTEMKAKIEVITVEIMTFDYFLCVSIGLLILFHSDNFSKIMQNMYIGRRRPCSSRHYHFHLQSDITIFTFKSLHNDPSFKPVR